MMNTTAGCVASSGNALLIATFSSITISLHQKLLNKLVHIYSSYLKMCTPEQCTMYTVHDIIH